MNNTKKDIYQQVTDEIIVVLERGTKPWVKPWQGGNAGAVCRPLRHNGIPYTGINILMLWLKAEQAGYTAPIWITYKQAVELGGQVRKGEKGALVVYANTFCISAENEEGKEEETRIPFLKSYVVFNVEQITGLPESYYELNKPKYNNQIERIGHAEQFFKNTNADIRCGGNVACFNPIDDYIKMPDLESFSSGEAYIATLSHETIHWTGHKSRLDRLTAKSFGSIDYAKEELVAELGAAFLCADLNIVPMLEHHASYINSWLEVLKKDKRAIFSAASKAQKAAEYLHSLQQ